MNIFECLEEFKREIPEILSFMETNLEKKIDFDKFQELYSDNPQAFCEDILELFPDTKQVEIMNSIRDNKFTSVKAGVGVGKTAITSALILWYMCTKENALIVPTSPSMNQLFTVLWSEISRWYEGTILENYLEKTKTRLYMKGLENTWYTFPKTATEKEGMSGLHTPNMLIIIDECSGVKEDICETLFATCTHPDNRFVAISNPTKLNGFFYETFHTMKDTFYNITINSENCERVDRNMIDAIAKKYGKDSNLYLIRVKGEFPKAEDDVFIPFYLVDESMHRETKHEPVYSIQIGLDLADSEDGDKTVIAARINNKVEKLIKYKGRADDSLINIIINKCFELKSKNKEYFKTCIAPICLDASGLGSTFALNLKKEMTNTKLIEYFPIKEIKFSTKRFKDYHDVPSYLWGCVRELLIEELLILPNDDDLLAQFTNRKYSINRTSAKIQIEPKDQLKKRGLPSPDCADSVALSCLETNKTRKKGRNLNG